MSPLFVLCYAKRISKETAKSLEEDTDLCQSSLLKDFRLHVGWRTIKTAVSAMLLVNYFSAPARVVSLWEGFKGSFKKGSKV